MTIRAVLYSRPCPACFFGSEEQERLARAAGEAASATVVGTWREPAQTARRRRNGLPARSAMARNLFGIDAVFVAEVAALGRSLADLVEFTALLQGRGIQVLIADAKTLIGVRPVTPADLDAARRAYRREAVVEGRERARRNGVRLGRPPVPHEKVAAVLSELARGSGLRAAARSAGVGVATAFRVRARATDLSPP